MRLSGARWMVSKRSNLYVNVIVSLVHSSIGFFIDVGTQPFQAIRLFVLSRIDAILPRLPGTPVV
jgi:hypothetical protein